MLQKGEQQSTLYSSLNQNKGSKSANKQKTTGHLDKYISQNKRQKDIDISGLYRFILVGQDTSCLVSTMLNLK